MKSLIPLLLLPCIGNAQIIYSYGGDESCRFVRTGIGAYQNDPTMCGVGTCVIQSDATKFYLFQPHYRLCRAEPPLFLPCEEQCQKEVKSE